MEGHIEAHSGSTVTGTLNARLTCVWVRYSVQTAVNDVFRAIPATRAHPRANKVLRPLLDALREAAGVGDGTNFRNLTIRG